MPNIVINMPIGTGFWNNGRVSTSGFSGRLASDNRKFRENSSFPILLKVKRVGNFSRILIKFKPPNQVAKASWQLLLATEESLAGIQIGNTAGVPFLLFVLLYYLILPVTTCIIFKALNEVCKQTTFRNVKRSNRCRENTANDFFCIVVSNWKIWISKEM